jgi:hypothetical protein
MAIGNARLYRSSEQRCAELDKALRGLETARDVAIAIGQEARLDRVLQLIVKRGRALVDARSLIILLSKGGELVIAARAGRAADAQGARDLHDGTLHALGGLRIVLACALEPAQDATRPRRSA